MNLFFLRKIKLRKRCIWFIPAVATTVKSSPQAACAIRLPTISPPMTQGPVRDLKSPTPS